MAKVTFGSGAKVAVEPMKTMKTPLMERHPVIDPSAIKEAIMAELPKYDETFGSALKQLCEDVRSEFKEVRKEVSTLREHVVDMEGDLVILDDQIQTVKDEVEAMPEPQALVHPEVKSITHVKDVSKEVMEHIEANKQANKADYMCHANHIVAIEARLKAQMILNIVMASALVLTILSRFI